MKKNKEDMEFGKMLSSKVNGVVITIPQGSLLALEILISSVDTVTVVVLNHRSNESYGCFFGDWEVKRDFLLNNEEVFIAEALTVTAIKGFIESVISSNESITIYIIKHCILSNTPLYDALSIEVQDNVVGVVMSNQLFSHVLFNKANILELIDFDSIEEVA